MWLQLEYHPPELVAGGPPTACIDVWAIGITCWELLIGARPLSLEDLGGPLPAVQEWRGGNQFGQQRFDFLAACLCFDTDVRATALARSFDWLLPSQQ